MKAKRDKAGRVGQLPAATWQGGRRWLAVAAVALASAGVHAEIDVVDAAQSLVKAGQGEQAMALLEARLAKDPANFQLRYLKAVSLIDIGKMADAATLFDALIKDAPQVAELYNNRGFARAQLKQYSLAMQDFEDAIQRKPNYALAHENLGLLHVALAEMAMGQATRLDQDNPRIRARYAAIKAAQQAQNTDAAQPAGDRLLLGPPPGSEADEPAGAVSSDAASIGKMVDVWRAAWSGKDMAAYFNAYAADFKGNFASTAEWRADRERKIAGKLGAISLDLSNIAISFRPDGSAEASFVQSYRAPGLYFKDQKQLVMRTREGRWVIVQEKARSLLPPPKPAVAPAPPAPAAPAEVNAAAPAAAVAPVPAAPKVSAPSPSVPAPKASSPAPSVPAPKASAPTPPAAEPAPAAKPSARVLDTVNKQAAKTAEKSADKPVDTAARVPAAPVAAPVPQPETRPLPAEVKALPSESKPVKSGA